MAFLGDILEDLRASCGDSMHAQRVVFTVCFNEAFQAVVGYRVARRLFLRGNKLGAHALSYACRRAFGAELSPLAEIGPGFKLVHGHGTVVGGGSVVGRNVTMYQGVTLGTGNPARGDLTYPVLEDDVAVYCGAKIVGALRVGRGAVVGANSVVVRDVAPGDIVAGIPAKPVSARRRAPRPTPEQAPATVNESASDR